MARPKSRKRRRPPHQERAVSAPTTSALVRPSRSIATKTKLHLYTHAAGRCEFDGCPKYLIEHSPTGTKGNLAEIGHIWAFNEGGPRGRARGRPTGRAINAIENLILLCPECHFLVDEVAPEKYPVSVLRKFKKDHEKRVFELTGIPKDRHTIPVVIKGLVQGRSMDISDEEMQLAVAPNYIRPRDKVEIDLSSPDQPNAAYWQSMASTIDHRVQFLHGVPVEHGRSLQVSVFGIARIPLLIYAGARLTDKVKVELFQLHRHGRWNWKRGKGVAAYSARRLRKGDDTKGVAFLVNLSGENGASDLPATVRKMPVYELSLRDQDRTPLFLNCRGDLERFRAEFIRALARIRAAHPNKRIHLFPAVPAPVAIAIGLDRLPNADAPFIIYDRDRDAAGFVRTLEVK